MSQAKCSLQQLIDEWHVAARLEQHHKISELNLEIASELVRQFDEQLIRDDEDQDDDDYYGVDERERAEKVICNSDWQLVKKYIEHLRKQSILARLYLDVLEFVRNKDRECLDTLHSPTLIAKDRTIASALPNARELCDNIRSLRRCIVLLRECNISNGKLNDSSKAFDETNPWLPSSKVTRLSSVGFPRFILNLDDGSNQLVDAPTAACNFTAAHTEDRNSEPPEDNSFRKTISSQWFKEHLRAASQYRPYALDRFTILVALWIVATGCRHATLEQLVGELVDQIFHQETNCSQPEDLLELSQVGAVWVSWRKRFTATIGRPRQQATPVEYQDEDSGSDSGGSDHQLDDEHRSSNSSAAAKRLEDKMNTSEAITLLRQVIDRELLVGRSCYLCGHEPSGDLLEPIQLANCPKCSLSWWRSQDHFLKYCGSSLDPLDWLVPLADLMRPLNGASRQLLVLSPNEWVQLALSACTKMSNFTLLSSGQSDGRNSAREQSSWISEQVDISDKFERLVVVRREVSGQEADEFAQFSDEEQQEDDIERGDNEERAGEEDVAKQRRDPMAESIGQLVHNFARRYGGSRRQRSHLEASESLEVIRLAMSTAATSDAPPLAIYAPDLVAFDALNDSINLYLIVTRRRGGAMMGSTGASWGATGSRARNYSGGANSKWPSERQRRRSSHLVRACNSRSQVSQLMLGCGRLFGAHEYGGVNGAVSDSAKCPACGCQLAELRAGAGFCPDAGDADHADHDDDDDNNHHDDHDDGN